MDGWMDAACMHAFLDFHQPHFVAIQETKIDSSIATSELFPETCSYNVYRKDRNLHGGCVMLLIHTKKLFIMWQVGIGNLVVLVKTSSCFHIRNQHK